jgi:excisionase family DNA binding protein
MLFDDPQRAELEGDVVTGNPALDVMVEATARRVVELLRGEDARLMRIKEAATYIGISRRTLEGLMSTGRIPTVREGSLIRLDRQDLDHWIEMRKTRA